MKKMIFCLLWVMGNLLYGQSDWQVEEIDNTFSIALPGAAEQIDTFDQRLLYLELDSMVFFVSKAKGTTPNVSNRQRLAEYYDGLVNGFIDQTGARLLDENDVQIKGLEARNIRVEFSYSRPESSFGPLRDSASSMVQDIRQVQFLLYNEHTYALQFWYTKPTTASKREAGETFFASIDTLESIDYKLQFTEGEAVATETNPLVGETVLYIGMVLLIAFVYMLGRWVARSRKFS